MPRKKTPKQCECGCKQMTAGGDFKPGHDAKTLAAIVAEYGSVLELKKEIERILNRPIIVVHD